MDREARGAAVGGGAPAPRTPRRRAALLLALLALAAFAVAPARADLRRLESEFRAAIERVEGATVVVVPAGSPDGGVSASGVLVSRDGFVLTDVQAGRVDAPKTPMRLLDEVEVRVPDLAKRTFTNWKARVVARLPDVHSALLKITNPPRSGFASSLPPATAEGLRPGSFTFAMGNSFRLATEAPPSLTAGVVAALAGPQPGPGATTDRATPDFLYTTAAINPGVAGGPLVDVRGRLVGVVAGWVDAANEPSSPYQFLGRVVPIDRLRAAYLAVGLPEAAAVFGAPPPKALAAEEAGALELVVSRTAATAQAGVPSLEIRRKEGAGVSSAVPGPGGKPVDLARYRGPVSAIAATEDGLVVTSLYGITNLTTLLHPGATEVLPAAAWTRTGIDAVEGAVLHLGEGRSAPARLVAVHEGLGLAAFRADLPEGTKLTLLPPAPPEQFAEGRFVVAVANPFGARAAGPLVTLGILSKQHEDDAGGAWRGHWQTDARGTDANSGGAAVDLRGRLLGMLALWDPAQHGRASGIAFVLPWHRIAAVLPDLAAGKSFRRPLLGVLWDTSAMSGARVQLVLDGSAAQAAGIAPGDEIVELAGRPVASIGDCGEALSRRWAGEVVAVKVRRGATILDLTATLGFRD